MDFCLPGFDNSIIFIKRMNLQEFYACWTPPPAALPAASIPPIRRLSINLPFPRLVPTSNKEPAPIMDKPSATASHRTRRHPRAGTYKEERIIASPRRPHRRRRKKSSISRE